MTNVIYGSEISKSYRDAYKKTIDLLRLQGKRVPKLSVILVGDNPASISYVTGKQKACASIGMDSELIKLSSTTSQDELKEVIERLNNDDQVDGILLQLPLPSHLDEQQAIACIVPSKDVDGLTTTNTGYLYQNVDGFVPCTPLGIMTILEHANCQIAGKRAVIMGRSRLVGMPIAQLLQQANATVTIVHSKTQDIKQITRQADILIVAVGKAKMIDASYVKEGAYVVDVGINKVDGKLVGDVDFEDVLPHVTMITPVPKGVGPMTICMLLSNTLKAYMENQYERYSI